MTLFNRSCAVVPGTIIGDLGAVRPGVVALGAFVTVGGSSILGAGCSMGVVGSAASTGAGGEPSGLIGVVNSSVDTEEPTMRTSDSRE